MALETSKNLGGVGALLLVIGVLPILGGYSGLIDLIGFILVLVALNGIANYYRERGIFNYALYGVIAAIVGGVVTAAIVFVSLVDLLHTVGLTVSGLLSDPTAVSRVDWTALFSISGGLTDTAIRFLGSLAIAVVILFVFLLLAAFFVRRSFSLTADKTGVGMFRTTGTLLLVGAVLTIIIFGILLIFIAMILLIVSFFSISTQQPAAMAPPPPPAAPQQPV